MSRRFLVIGSFAAIYLLWGSTYFAITLGLQSIPPFLLMALRSLCGGIVLLAMRAGEVGSVSLQSWVKASLCGLLFFVGCHGVLAFAQQSVPSGVAAIVRISVLPVVWLLAAASSWSVGTVLSRSMSNQASAILLSGMQLSIGGAVLLAIS